MKAKEEPRKAGTFILVRRWKIRVPSPAKRRVADIDSPVIIGTSTVAPNIAKRCWRPSTAIFGAPRVRASNTALSAIGLFQFH